MESNEESKSFGPCTQTGCGKPATNAVGIELWPPKALQDYYRIYDRFITRLVMDLKVCEEHLPGWEEIGGLDNFEPVIKAVERTSSTTVDRANCKIVAVPFDATDYQMLLKQNEGAANDTGPVSENG